MALSIWWPWKFSSSFRMPNPWPIIKDVDSWYSFMTGVFRGDFGILLWNDLEGDFWRDLDDDFWGKLDGNFWGERLEWRILEEQLGWRILEGWLGRRFLEGRLGQLSKLRFLKWLAWSFLKLWRSFLKWLLLSFLKWLKWSFLKWLWWWFLGEWLDRRFLKCLWRSFLRWLGRSFLKWLGWSFLGERLGRRFLLRLNSSKCLKFLQFQLAEFSACTWFWLMYRCTCRFT